eukprot:6193998-Pleurochrysis_carterae.AAC.2
MSEGQTKKQKLSEAEAMETKPLISAALLKEEFPVTPVAASTHAAALAEVRAVLEGKDDRLIVIVGPCSVCLAGKPLRMFASHA